MVWVECCLKPYHFDYCSHNFSTTNAVRPDVLLPDEFQVHRDDAYASHDRAREHCDSLTRDNLREIREKLRIAPKVRSTKVPTKNWRVGRHPVERHHVFASSCC